METGNALIVIKYKYTKYVVVFLLHDNEVYVDLDPVHFSVTYSVELFDLNPLINVACDPFYSAINSTKWAFKHRDLLIYDLKLNKYE